MLILNSKKGGFGAAIIIAVIAVAMVFGGVLYFFFVFKAHATLEARDEYIWNKVQEVPLSLLSTDFDGESFVSRINKVHYEFADMDSLRDVVSGNISKQLFFFYEGTAYPFEYFISISGMTTTGKTDCKCKGPFGAVLTGKYSCTSGCGAAIEGKNCAKNLFTLQTPFGPVDYYMPDNSQCFGEAIKTYSAAYPFPLTFNGTNDFVTILSYEVMEWRE